MSKPNSKWEPILFSLILSGLMSFMVSGLTIFRTTGLIDGFMMNWIGAWVFAWAIAFPTILVVAPIARRIVARVFRG